jgi:hypothetical protein
MQKLTSIPFPVKVGYSIKKITDDLTRQRKVMADEYNAEIVEAHAKRDEKNEIVRPEKGSPGDFIPADPQKLAEAVEAFGDRSFEIKRNKIRLSELGDVQLSVSELTVLEPLISDVELGLVEGPVEGATGIANPA